MTYCGYQLKILSHYCDIVRPPPFPKQNKAKQKILPDQEPQ